MCIFIPNMKFPGLILWLGWIATENDNDDDDDNNAGYMRTKHDCICSLIDEPNEPKTSNLRTLPTSV